METTAEIQETETETELIKCVLCGNQTDDCEEINYNGDVSQICESCREDLNTCDRCGIATEDITEVHIDHGTDEYYCESCRNHHIFICTDCSDRWHDDAGFRVHSDETVCISCYESNYFTCDDCGEVRHNDYYAEDGFCVDCVPSEDNDDDDYDSCGIVRPYHSVNVPNLLGFFPPNLPRLKTLFYGIELETQCPNADLEDLANRTLDLIGSDFVVLESDSSIGRGFEIISAPATVEVHKNRWERFLNSIPTGLHSWKSGDCGIHIHVSKRPLSQLTIGQLTTFLNDDGNKGLVSAIAGRYASSYCKIKPKKPTSPRTENWDRYEALNLTNQHTIEFRIFRGTLNKVHFFANLEFCESLIFFCRHYGLRDLNQTAFLAWLQTEHKAYSNLHDFFVGKNLLKSVSKPKPLSSEDKINVSNN